MFPSARSLLMDRDTLLAHRALWGQEDAENHIIAADLEYTIIRPGQLTSNPRSGVIRLDLEPSPTGPITRGDLADQVVGAYDDVSTIRQIYQVIGDDPLAVRRMGEALGD